MTYRQIILTTNNLWLIESLLLNEKLDPMVEATLREKAATALVVTPRDVPADVVTLDSRVHFTLAGRNEECRLVASAEREVRGQTLVLGTPLGATLIGMREGNTGSTACWDGSYAEVLVRSVGYQPEAARRGARLPPRLRVNSPEPELAPTPRRSLWDAPNSGPRPIAS